MPKVNDLAGQRFGRLTVLERAGNDNNGKAVWRCKGECNNEVAVVGQNLLRGRTKSCGCLFRGRSHGRVGTRLHRIWTGMKTRCNNPHSEAFQRYGGRGVAVCSEWEHNFQAFYDWAMANGYADKLTLDRKDNDKGYSPENCRWATENEQQNNRRNNHMVTYNGKTQTVSQWADEMGIKRATLSARLNRYKWDIGKALGNDEGSANETTQT